MQEEDSINQHLKNVGTLSVNYTAENFENMGMQITRAELLAQINALFSIILNQVYIVENAVLKYGVLKQNC